uniref:Uncharacterized protein n=1 Tax=Cyanothece sp. (strain PCC 7425 / ATCC 29141) TaxID=395961 RepID=B8HU92_CYAP4
MALEEQVLTWEEAIAYQQNSINTYQARIRDLPANSNENQLQERLDLQQNIGQSQERIKE